MTNETYWAIRRREIAKAKAPEVVEKPAKKAKKEKAVADEPIEEAPVAEEQAGELQGEEGATVQEAQAEEVSDSPEGEAEVE
jgi:hypothetical protein